MLSCSALASARMIDLVYYLSILKERVVLFGEFLEKDLLRCLKGRDWAQDGPLAQGIGSQHLDKQGVAPHLLPLQLRDAGWFLLINENT